MFNYFNTSRKFRGGENRKTEIQKKGVGEAEFLYLYYSTIICNGGQRGWGSWGRLLRLAHLALPSLPVARPLHLLAATQAPTSRLPSSSGIGSSPRETSCSQPSGLWRQNERFCLVVLQLCYQLAFHLSLKCWFSPP